MNKFILLIISVILYSSVSGQQDYWSSRNNNAAITTDKAVARLSFPKEFKLFELNMASIKQELFSITDNQPRHSTVITLPNADGNVEQFEVFEASNFEPDLQARFPEIRAFSGRGITDKYATLKLSISPQGIQTMVFRTEKENEFIEPYSQDHRIYAVFRSHRDKGKLPWTCTTDDKQMDAGIRSEIAKSPAPLSSAGQLKTMRLAQSCNGEYSNYFGATSAAQVSLVLAAFNATLTRCNGCYEKDLALHLNLISNTTSVIYYDPATDPYTTLANWNSQLQSTLTSVIGEANYDIGHMFGASGGGGNAGCIGCVCVDGQKGSGITSPADGIPQGDNFDIDYVVHEVGHQLGGNHTFSYSLEGTGVNKEVGAGITIMGYAGITSYDPAPHSIDIYHEATIAQIQSNLAGKTCPVTVAMTANHAPVVAAVSNYTIPISTPFALTGSATDADGDPLTYCWEQNDNSTTSGANSVASPTKATGPNWLSFSPTSSPTRLFPNLSTILSGLLVTPVLPGGDAVCNIEALSSVSRTLNFRLTVRDNHPYVVGSAIGQTQFTDMVVTVSNTSGPFQVTAPNTSVTWAGGSSQTVTWNVASTTASPVSCSNVKITLSTDGGTTFPTVLAASVPNNGSALVTIPNTATTTARIKVEAVGNIFFDISNTNFTITAGTGGFTFNTPTAATATCPAPASMQTTLSATYTGGFTNNITLTASGNPPGTTVVFGTNPLTTTSASSTVSLTGTNTLSNGSYVITVTGTATGATTQNQNVTYTINAGTGPAITQQPASQSVCQGGNASFTVTATGATAYQWQLSTDGGITYNSIPGATSSTCNITNAQNNGSYRCVVTGQCGTSNSNAATLTVIILPAVTAPTLTQPSCATTTGTIAVNATGSGTLEYSLNGGAYQLSNTFSGLVPGNYTIAVRLQSSPSCVANYSGNPVVINAVPVAPTVNAPTVTQPTCATTTGTIVVNATGNGTLEYNLNGGTFQASSTFSGLVPGNYTISARLQSSPSCVTSYSGNPVVINAVPVAPVVSAPTVTQPTCAVQTGTIVINATGSGTLEYSLNGGAYQLSNTFSSLAPGNYTISVRLQSSPTCITSYSGNPVVITAAAGLPVVNAPTLTQPTCTTPSGRIVVNATGSGTLEYRLNTGTYQTSSTFSNLAPGNYNISVRLQSTPACVTNYSGNPVVINAIPVAPVVTAPTVTQPTCATTTGRIVVNATGSGTLQYRLNTGAYQTSNTFSNLAPGNYNISVRLQSSTTCVTTYSGNPVVINAVPVAPVVSAPTVTQPTCATPSGSIVVNATGSGTLEYSINGTAYQLSSTFSGLAPGSYTVSARLQSSPTCVTPYSGNPVVINAVPVTPVVNAPGITQPTCATPSGTIAVNATGSGTLEYNINGGAYQLSNTFSGLTPGNYTISVRFQSSPTCVTNYSGNPVVIDAVPVVPVVSAPTLTQPTCATPSGTIVVNATGSGTLEYNINGGAYQLSNTFSGLTPGNYTLAARLQSSPTCVTNYSSNPVVVNAVPVAPAINAPTLTQPTCATPTGTIAVNATGSGTIEYNINSGAYQLSNIFSGLAPGNYTLTARLQSSPTCITSYSGNPVVIVAAPDAPVVDAPSVTQPTCAAPSGTIMVNATGSGTLEYNINGGAYQLSNTFSGLVPGNYTISVRLQSSPTCVTPYSGNPVVVNAVPAAPVVNTPTVTQPTCASSTGTIVVNATGSGTLEYSLNGGPYQLSNSFSGLNAGNYSIAVRLQSVPTCVTNYSGNPVVINTAPVVPNVDPVSSQVIGNGATTAAIPFTGSVPGTVYDWVNNTPGIGLAASGNGNIAPFTAINTSNTPVTATITVTPSYTNGGGTCTGTPYSFTITVNPPASYIHASVKKDADPSKIDIVFKPNYTNAAGEYVNYFQFSVAIPAAGNSGVTVTATGVNAFQDLGNLLLDGPYTEGSEIVYNFGYLNPNPPTTNNYTWTNGNEFTGVVVTFSNTNAASVGKMVDFSNSVNGFGGANGNTLFGVVTNTGDKTDFSPNSLFYAIPGESALGNYPISNDQYVQTLSCSGAVGGTASGSTTLCVAGTPTITASGYSTGPNSGYQWQYSNDNFVSDVHDFTGQVNPAILSTGAVSSTTYYRLKVTCPLGTAVAYSTIVTVTVIPSVNAGTVSGNTPLCIAATAAYSSNGNTGGSWSSSNSTVATVDATTGLVTAVNAGTTNIIYTVNTGCNAPQIASQVLTVNTCTLPNDDAPGAITLTPGAGCSGSPYTNAGATQSAGEPFAACQGTAGYKTVWYKFTATGANVRVSCDYSGGTMGADTRLALFSTTNVNDYASFTPLACDDDNGITVPGSRSILYYTGLTVGNTYYIQVDGKDATTTAGSFCLTVDDMTSTDIATSTACTAGQDLSSVNNNYTGWMSLTDANGKLVALVSPATAGTGTSTYSNSININTGAVRTDAASNQRYLNRNYTINNAAVSNVKVQFFFLNPELAALQAADPAVSLSNLQATRQTGTVCDNNFVAGNGTNSAILQSGNGSDASGFNWIQLTAPGFSKFYLHTRKSYAPVKTWLQGAYSTTLLRHKNITAAWAGVMNGNALNQPYNVPGFGNYTGTESVSSGFFTATTATTDILDWVLLELRDATNPSTVITRRAAFIREDGRIVDLDGISDVSFRTVADGNYYVVIRHRNHLGIRSSATMSLNSTLGIPVPAIYDFSSAQAQAYQNPGITTNAAMADMGGTGVFGMRGGNANGSAGSVTSGNATIRANGGTNPLVNDYLYLITTQLGGNVNINLSNVYNNADLNLDGTVRANGGTNPAINDYIFLTTTALGGSNSIVITQHL